MRPRLHHDPACALDIVLAASFGIVAIGAFLAAGWPRLGVLPHTAVTTVHRAAASLAWRSEYLVGLTVGLVAIAVIVVGSLLATAVVLARHRGA